MIQIQAAPVDSEEPGDFPLIDVLGNRPGTWPEGDLASALEALYLSAGYRVRRITTTWAQDVTTVPEGRKVVSETTVVTSPWVFPDPE